MGVPYAVREVREFCDRHRLWLVEDNCDALGSRYDGQLTATFGDGHEPWSAALRLLAEVDVVTEDGPAPPPASPSVLRLPRREGTHAYYPSTSRAPKSFGWQNCHNDI